MKAQPASSALDAQLSRHIPNAGVKPLLVVVELCDSEPKLVHHRRTEGSNVAQQPLFGSGQDVGFLILKIGDFLIVLVVPAKPAVPGRLQF